MLGTNQHMPNVAGIGQMDVPYSGKSIYVNALSKAISVLHALIA